VAEAEDEVRRFLASCGLNEAITYAFIRADLNASFTDEEPVRITNSLSENTAVMRLSLLPGLLESVAFNRSYGSRDGGLFEVGRTYHRSADGVVERSRAAFVLFGATAAHWGDPRRPLDFFDAKGIIERLASRFHVELEFARCDRSWLRSGKRAVARDRNGAVATLGVVAPEILQRFDIKGEVVAAELELGPLIAEEKEWTMAPVARFPGVPMILAVMHAHDLEYQRIVEAIWKFDVPFLHEVGLRDRYAAPGETSVKTTLGMWYQAFDRSLTQQEVSDVHRRLAARLSSALPLKVL
ncbi:MAG TPA: hypothetical protein VFL80_06460, partial [Thermoanaerobaculia bacterium]|nr:hypothetical protein [Thermoanaerobaculia bacterium]